jgi:hypothetical protein
LQQAQIAHLHGHPKQLGREHSIITGPLMTGAATMRPLNAKDKAALERIDQLPRGAAVRIRLAALYTNTSERTWRDNPPIPTFFLTPHTLATNVGLLRDLTSGKLAQSTAS